MPAKRDPVAAKRIFLRAADEVIQDRGAAAAGLNTIIEKSGQSKGAFFHYFKDKNQLILTWLTELVSEKLEQIWINPLQQNHDPLKSLREIFHLLPAGTLTFTALHGAVNDDDIRQAKDEILTTWHTAIANALREGQKNHTVHPQIKPDDEAHFIIHLALGREHAAAASLAAFERSFSAYLETLRPI